MMTTMVIMATIVMFELESIANIRLNSMATVEAVYAIHLSHHESGSVIFKVFE